MTSVASNLPEHPTKRRARSCPSSPRVRVRRELNGKKQRGRTIVSHRNIRRSSPLSTTRSTSMLLRKPGRSARQKHSVGCETWSKLSKLSLGSQGLAEWVVVGDRQNHSSVESTAYFVGWATSNFSGVRSPVERIERSPPLEGFPQTPRCSVILE